MFLIYFYKKKSHKPIQFSADFSMYLSHIPNEAPEVNTEHKQQNDRHSAAASFRSTLKLHKLMMVDYRKKMTPVLFILQYQ